MPNLSIGLSMFADYANAGGMQKVEIVNKQFERVTNPDRPAYMYYRAPEAAFKQAITGEVEVAIRNMLAQATPRSLRNFEQIAAGIRTFKSAYSVSRVAVETALWEASGLTVRIDRLVGLRIKNEEFAVFPYMKEPPITTDAKRAIQRIIELKINEIRPGAVPAVVDIRRGKLHKITRFKRSAVDAWLEADAEYYVNLWGRQTA